MSNEFDEEIREFLIESNENLTVLDKQLVELERHPKNHELISSIFRTIHSIKGTCGFFGFDVLGSVTHLTESILMQLREGQRDLTPELISLILEAVDATKLLLMHIETTGSEGEDETEELRQRLDEAYQEMASGNTIKDMMEAAQERTEEMSSSPEVQLLSSEPELQDVPVVPTVKSELEINPVHVQRPAAVVEQLAQASQQKPVTSVATEYTGDLLISDSTIRVDVNQLNQLMNLVGELVLTRNQLLQAAGEFSPAVQQTSQRLNIITTELQEGVMKTRMQPIGVVWNKLPRIVRDLASKCGKQIQLEMYGSETELDKSLIEAIRDPLTHIVRNSCDHGIEDPKIRLGKGKPAEGTLVLRAFHEAGAVNIEISDDGAGINANYIRAKAVEKKLITAEQAAAMSDDVAVNLIFLPGLSTAQQVTSISGRGVGMDVVKTNIERISGSVEVVAPQDGGTIIKIKIPLTLAIIPGLIVSCNVQEGKRQDRFVIPQSHLVEMTRVDLSSPERLIDTVNGATIFRHRGKLLPLLSLTLLLQIGVPSSDETFINIIVLQVAGRQFGLVVDNICDTQEIVVKPLGQQLKHLSCYGGATIMGDGQPALILDVGGIAQLAALDTQHRSLAQVGADRKTSDVVSEMLIFRGEHQRMALPLSIVNRLEELPAESVERAASQQVIPYRGELLPLLHADSILRGELEPPDMLREGTLKVIVINDGDRRSGLVVDEIVDIVQERIDVMRGSSRPFVMGSAVIGGMVTDLLDIAAIHSRTQRDWSRSAHEPGFAYRVMFHDPWSLSREMLRVLLNSAGYLATHVNSNAELKSAMSEGAADVFLIGEASRYLPSWIKTAKQERGILFGIPLILATDTLDRVSSADKNIEPIDAYVDRHDRTEILRCINTLIHATEDRRDGTNG